MYLCVLSFFISVILFPYYFSYKPFLFPAHERDHSKLAFSIVFVGLDTYLIDISNLENSYPTLSNVKKFWLFWSYGDQIPNLPSCRNIRLFEWIYLHVCMYSLYVCLGVVCTIIVSVHVRSATTESR